MNTFQKKEFNIVRKTLEATENVLERSVAVVPSFKTKPLKFSSAVYRRVLIFGQIFGT